MVDKTAEEFKALGEIAGGDIHIGCAESEGIRHLARRIKGLQEQHPGIRVHLYSGDTNDLAGRLEQGLLDFAVIAQEVDLRKYNYLELPWADTWGVVMRKDDPLSEKKEYWHRGSAGPSSHRFPPGAAGGSSPFIRGKGRPAECDRHHQSDL